MKAIIVTLGLLAVLLVSCNNPKSKTVEENLQIETVIVKEPLGSLGNLPQLIEASELKGLMRLEDEGFLLIDVRTAEEFAAGHLNGAVNIDVNDASFNDEIQKFLRDEPVFLYCRSGVRSARAAKLFAALGYRAYDLDKGIQGWEKQGFPIE
jgi:rhodanese-related sulfurtransferase